MAGQSSFRPSDVAIICGDARGVIDLDVLQKAIDGMLKQEYNLETTTIRDHVMNDNTDKVVFGTVEDCMSYEAPCVIYIDIGVNESMYSLLSRARTRLSFIICCNEHSSDPFLQRLSQLGTRVTWVDENSNFTKKNYYINTK